MMTAPSCRRTLGAALLLAAVAAGCDFTPTLDIDTPDYEPGVVVRSVLVADSAATVWVSESWNPYGGQSSDYNPYHGTAGGGRPPIEADVALYRDGQLVERLTAQRDSCIDSSQPTVPQGGVLQTYPCGPYVGTVPIEAGATYTIRVEAAELPPAEATVTVPLGPEVTITEETVAAGAPRRFRVALRDRSGAGDLYGLSLLRWAQISHYMGCDENGCQDTTYVTPSTAGIPTAFETSDPVLIAAAREFDGSVSFASFPDETFEGGDMTFTISPSRNYDPAAMDYPISIQVAALSGDVYDAYQIMAFSGGDDNPFAEPINLPSNVTGGYGLVGAVALAEATFEARAPSGP